MTHRGILSLLMLLLLASCATPSGPAAGDEYEDEAASSEEEDGDSDALPSPTAASEKPEKSEMPAESAKKTEKAPEDNSGPPLLAQGREKGKKSDPPVDPGPPIPGGTKHGVLSRSFETATELPDLSDFDLLDDPQPVNRCLASRPGSPDQMMEMVIRQMPVPYPATPSFGPLFPGSPPKVETSLVIGRDNGWVTGVHLTDEKRRVFELHQIGTTLVIRILPNPFGIYQDFGNPAEVWIRKGADGNLFFKVYRIDQRQNRAEAFVGYCFRRS